MIIKVKNQQEIMINNSIVLNDGRDDCI